MCIRDSSTGVQILSNRGVKVTGIRPDGEPIITDLMAFDEYLAPYFSYSRFFSSKILWGVTLKGLYHRIHTGYEVYKSKAIAFDAGVQYIIVPTRIIAGAVIRNAGFEFSSFTGESSYNLPLTFETGISYVPRYLPSTRLILDVNKTIGDYINIEPGIELEIYENLLYGRAGYLLSQHDLKEFLAIFTGNREEDYVKSNWTTLTAGLGLNLPIKSFLLTLDFAIQFRAYSVPPSIMISTMFDF
ncbi:MAG: hypothetical protein N2053_11160, partial [Chitinispirillaceae bacterium]|nr:hypothetical protein [Chitinispirillaceae bacterium]